MTARSMKQGLINWSKLVVSHSAKPDSGTTSGRMSTDFFAQMCQLIPKLQLSTTRSTTDKKNNDEGSSTSPPVLQLIRYLTKFYNYKRVIQALLEGNEYEEEILRMLLEVACVRINDDATNQHHYGLVNKLKEKKVLLEFLSEAKQSYDNSNNNSSTLNTSSMLLDSSMNDKRFSEMCALLESEKTRADEAYILMEQLKVQVQTGEEHREKFEEQEMIIMQLKAEIESNKQNHNQELADANLLMESTLGIANDANARLRDSEKREKKLWLEIKAEKKNNELVEVGFAKIIKRQRIDRIVLRACNKFSALLLEKRKLSIESNQKALEENIALKNKVKILQKKCEALAGSSSSSSSVNSATINSNTPKTDFDKPHCATTSNVEISALSNKLKQLLQELQESNNENVRLKEEVDRLKHQDGGGGRDFHKENDELDKILRSNEARIKSLYDDLNLERLNVNAEILKRATMENECSALRKELAQVRGELVSAQLALARVENNSNVDSVGLITPVVGEMKRTGRPSVFYSNGSLKSASSSSLPLKSVLEEKRVVDMDANSSNKKQRVVINEEAKNDPQTDFGSFVIPKEDLENVHSNVLPSSSSSSSTTNRMPRRSFFKPSVVQANSSSTAFKMSAIKEQEEKPADCKQQ